MVNVFPLLDTPFKYMVNVVFPLHDTPFKYKVNVVLPVIDTPSKYMDNVVLPVIDTPCKYVVNVVFPFLDTPLNNRVNFFFFPLRDTNGEVLKAVGEESTISTRTKKNWIGNIMRNPEVMKGVIEGRMEGKRPRGR